MNNMKQRFNLNKELLDLMGGMLSSLNKECENVQQSLVKLEAQKKENGDAYKKWVDEHYKVRDKISDLKETILVLVK